jgi:hypothetical protein
MCPDGELSNLLSDAYRRGRVAGRGVEGAAVCQEPASFRSVRDRRQHEARNRAAQVASLAAQAQTNNFYSQEVQSASGDWDAREDQRARSQRSPRAICRAVERYVDARYDALFSLPDIFDVLDNERFVWLHTSHTADTQSHWEGSGASW